MSPETPKPSAEQENVQDDIQAARESISEETVDSRDLVRKSGYAADSDPEEVIENPAVAPQMPNEPNDIRHDLSRE